ncbi:MAG: MFS transporter [Gammaproteobacteria bacterium RIFCSPHIGHO2_12_FULL_38_14]|nr:MAG: MFS transporter [Gammaproteobacteria bacterium RIFCSPHIGHO2_12_FULL_38_14]
MEKPVLNRRLIASLSAWCLYDWASSSFSVNVTTFIFATYFTTHIAVNEITGTYQWANATSFAGILIAILSPLVGAIADHGGHHKAWLSFFTLLCIISTALLWFAYPHPQFVYYTLILVILGTIGFEVALVFYNAFLPSLAPKNMIGRISGIGWGCGYIGGIVSLAFMLFVFIRSHVAWLPTQQAADIRITGPFVAIWYALFALPLFFIVPDLSIAKQHTFRKVISAGCKELSQTLKKLPQEKNMLLYLIAHMIYADGMNTLFAFGGIYAAGTFGMSFQEVLVFGITMNITAGIGAIALGFMDDWLGSKKTIMTSLSFLILLGIPLLLLKQKYYFWIVALLLCLFVGPVQSASRSLMTRLIITRESKTEMFGLYALSGKITAFIGPWLLGLSTYIFQSQRFGMATVVVFFIIGMTLISFVSEEQPLSL